MIRKIVKEVLDNNDGLCLDNEEERNKLAAALETALSDWIMSVMYVYDGRIKDLKDEVDTLQGELKCVDALYK